MKNQIFAITLSTLSFLMATTVVMADGTCQTPYGYQTTCTFTSNIVINKTVQNPQTNAFVDNLSVNDPKYSPSQTVNFQLAITNTGTGTIGKTTVKDTFPQFVSFVAGPGTMKDNVLTFETDNLLPNETRTVNVTGKTADASGLPSDATVTCVVNQATATADNGQTSQDTAQLCIEKPGNTTTKGGLTVESLPRKTFGTPATGPEALPLLALIPTGLIGTLLRKKSILR